MRRQQEMKLRPFISGLASYLPASGKLHKLLSQNKIGPASARYCYAVWMRHLILAQKAGALEKVPETVAELGPGRSLGAGLAALLCGAKHYYGLDIANYTEFADNVAVLDELTELFAERGIVADEEFPDMRPLMGNWEFPEFLGDVSRFSLPKRIEEIKKDLSLGGGEFVKYFVPWNAANADWHADMIFSQAVLEHVDDAANAYRVMFERLNPGGVITHQIDYRSHGTADTWDGHRGYPPFLWSVIRGRKPYLINRLSHSQHTELIRRAGFKILTEIPVLEKSAITTRRYASDFQKLPQEDSTISGAFICAVKPK